MTDRWTTLALAGVLFAACAEPAAPSNSEREEDPPAVETSPAVAVAQPGDDPPRDAPQALGVDQPAVEIAIPIPPSFELTIEEAGEYQIDVDASSDADPTVYLYDGDTLVEEDDDGGEASDARIVRFLEPGAYSVRVSEHRARPFTASVRAQRLAPLEPEGAFDVGATATLVFPELPLLTRAENDRDAAKSLTLTIRQAGDYLCIARMDNDRFVRMRLIAGGARVLASDEQRFTEQNASFTAHLDPGTYEVRLWDGQYRGDMRATVTCTRAPAPTP